MISTEDYTPLPPSPREVAAGLIPILLQGSGVSVSPQKKSRCGRFRYVTFEDMAAWGEVRVYSPTYVQVERRREVGTVFDKRVYASVEEACVYLALMAAGAENAARAVPTWVSSRATGRRPVGS